MAKTLVSTRREQGESIPEISTRRMAAMPANALAAYAARPARYRIAQLGKVNNDVVTFLYRAGN
jgi:hypothetical protein